MMYRGKIILSFFLMSLLLSCNAVQVRVLIDSASSSNKESWVITAEHGVVISHPKYPSKQSNCQSVTIKKEKSGFSVVDDQRRRLHGIQQVKVAASDDECCLYNMQPYQGSFVFLVYEGKGLVVNSLDIEDYIYSVLRTESFPGWPLEMNKVLAITCRSYVIAKILEAQRLKKPYHVVNTNKHQTYQGYHTSFTLKKAVEETSGTFISFNNQPILAMFDICCGGVVPSKKYGINFKHAPYLARDYACKFCKSCKSYQWSAEYSLADFERMVKCSTNKVRAIREVKVNKKDAAGLVQQVLIIAQSGYHYLSGTQLRSLSDLMRSTCFTIHKNAQNIIFKGRGFGHHMGLCQWGARQMVREGWNYTRILQYYYPGTNFMRLSLPVEVA